MRNVVLILLAMFMAGMVTAQPSEKWWKVDDYGLKYQLPDSWASDPFSTSSVCDCPGTINDNGGWQSPDYLGMVIYPTLGGEQDEANRNQVWGSEFLAETTTDTLEFAGIPYSSTYGIFEDLSLGEKAWKLLSIDDVGKKCMDLTVYFFGDPHLFDQQQLLFNEILGTFKREKVK